MNYQVVIVPRAMVDLERNALWWSEHHSSAQAQRWVDRVHEQLKSLATSPEMYALSIESSEFAFDIRDKFVGLASRAERLTPIAFAIKNQRTRRRHRETDRGRQVGLPSVRNHTPRMQWPVPIH